MPDLTIAGITPLTTTDFPGRLACVVFLQGCPWRCGYCHNPHLWPRESDSTQKWDHVQAFLERRRGLLDAVVFSGGEPTLQSGLAAALREVKNQGFLTGLHTGGAYPDRLRAVLPLLDWVGMDAKAPFGRYDAITNTPGSGERALESAKELVASGVEHEFRTTVHTAQLDAEDLFELAEQLSELGARSYALQEFRPQGCASDELIAARTPGFLDEQTTRRIGGMFRRFTVRRG